MVRRLLSARLWFAISGVMIVVALFVVQGAAGGVVAAGAAAAFLFACFRALRGRDVDDRPAWAGWFGGYF
jgi:hypothetical protein